MKPTRTGYIVWHTRDEVPLAICATYDEALRYGREHGFELAGTASDETRGVFEILEAPLRGLVPRRRG